MDGYEELKQAQAARRKMTKAGLLAEFGVADEAWANLSTEKDMAEMYYKSLETHLRAHGCEHDFADVAETPEVV